MSAQSRKCVLYASAAVDEKVSHTGSTTTAAERYPQRILSDAAWVCSAAQTLHTRRFYQTRSVVFQKEQMSDVVFPAVPSCKVAPFMYILAGKGEPVILQWRVDAVYD